MSLVQSSPVISYTSVKRNTCIVCPCFDKNMLWVHYNTSASEFTIKCFDKNISLWLLLVAFPLNWIHSKLITTVAFCIIGLTKLAKIEFLLLDWIYHSIRIMLVNFSRERERADPQRGMAVMTYANRSFARALSTKYSNSLYGAGCYVATNELVCVGQGWNIEVVRGGTVFISFIYGIT